MCFTIEKSQRKHPADFTLFHLKFEKFQLQWEQSGNSPDTFYCTLPSQKYGNSRKNPIQYNGKVPLVKCLKSNDADERI